MFRRGVAYSADLRERVLAAEGPSRAVAARFGVSVSYVVKARARLRDPGERGPSVARRAYPRRLEGHEAALAAEVERRVDATLAELRGWLLDERGVSVGVTALWREIARLGLTLKKRPSAPPSRTARSLRPLASPGAPRKAA
jgi:transposase